MLDHNITFDRVVIVEQGTEYDRMSLRYGSDEQAAFALNSRGTDLGNYQKLSAVYYSNAKKVTESIQGLPVERIKIDYVPLFNWQASDIVVLIGQDGLFPNVAKSLTTQPVICVNPDPTQVSGVIMIHHPDSIKTLVRAVRDHVVNIKPVSLGKVTTNDGQELLAANDFLIGRLDHRSARYRINHQTRTENHISSGVIVATPLGSTGWIKSAMRHVDSNWLRNLGEWETETLTFFVREAFESINTQTQIRYGGVNIHNPLTIYSEMPEGGVIFSDGMFEQYITFTTGTIATFGLAKHKINYVDI